MLRAELAKKREEFSRNERSNMASFRASLRGIKSVVYTTVLISFYGTVESTTTTHNTHFVLIFELRYIITTVSPSPLPPLLHCAFLCPQSSILKTTPPSHLGLRPSATSTLFTFYSSIRTFGQCHTPKPSRGTLVHDDWDLLFLRRMNFQSSASVHSLLPPALQGPPFRTVPTRLQAPAALGRFVTTTLPSDTTSGPKLRV